MTSTDGLHFTVTELGAPLTIGDGCSMARTHVAICSLPLGAQPQLRVDLADGDDMADLSGVELTGSCAPATVTGGTGDDAITALGGTACGPAQNVAEGGDGADALGAATSPATFTGGAGDDVLTGSRGPDALDGGAGDDLLDGRSGDDKLTGGDGTDTADYARRDAAVTVDLASERAVSGEDGEHDALGGVENAVGGAGDDVLLGGAGANVLSGGDGDDRLDGRFGPDRLVGGAGRDVADYSARTESVSLETGEDPVSGSAADGPATARDRIDPSTEELRGGAGADTLTGDDGDNILDGGPGADTLTGGDGEDAADYSSRDQSVELVPDGRPGSGGELDGPRGARDRIDPDVEDLWGGSGGDVLTGGPADNLLDGGPGADRMSGGSGEDAADYSGRRAGVIAALDGRPTSGNDEDGPAGERDVLGIDIEDLLGGDGDDGLTGNSARNFIAGQAGDDVIDGRGRGPDYADCGGGYDRSWIDPTDLAASDCERIGAGPESTGPALGGADRTAAQIRISLLRGQRIATVLSDGLRVHYTCSETCTLDARILLGRAAAKRIGIRLGPSTLLVARTPARRVGPGQGTFTMLPAKRIARRLAKVKRLDFALLVKGRDAAGNLTRLGRHLQLLPAKARLGTRARGR